MLPKILGTVDRFYPILAFALIILIALTVFTFKGVVSALTTAAKIDEQIAGSAAQLNLSKLDQVYEEAIQKRGISLDLGK